MPKYGKKFCFWHSMCIFCDILASILTHDWREHWKYTEITKTKGTARERERERGKKCEKQIERRIVSASSAIICVLLKKTHWKPLADGATIVMEMEMHAALLCSISVSVDAILIQFTCIRTSYRSFDCCKRNRTTSKQHTHWLRRNNES